MYYNFTIHCIHYLLKKQVFESAAQKLLPIFFLFINVAAVGNNSLYYIDQVGGNNSNAGTSTGAAWADFTHVNTMTFQPGDHILLKCGSVWNNEMHLSGSGNSGAFIIVDSYGSGNKPKIQRTSDKEDRTIFMTNTSYWKIRNIEVSNAGDGIRLNYSTKGNSSVYFENLYIHNIDLIVNASPATSDGVYYSTGITVSNGTSAKPSSSSDYVATDIRITNCDIAFTTAPFTFLHVFTNPSGSNTESPWSFKNILVDNNTFHDYKGPISTRDMNQSVISNNICKNGGNVHLPQGTTGFFNFDLDNVIFEGNVMDTVPNTGSGDQIWIDNEAYCNRVQLYGNMIKNTAGAGVEFLALGSGAQPPRSSDDYNVNNVIDGNSFYANGGGALHVGGSTPTSPSGVAKNNFYLSANSFFTGTSSGFTLTNNTASSGSDVNLARYKAYSSSSIYDSTMRASKAFDGDGGTWWQSVSGSFAGQWLRVNFGSPTTFDSVRLSEYDNRTSGFQIQYSNDGIAWITAYTGTSIGSNKAVGFTAVTAMMARIYFTSGSMMPIIFEFGIYKSLPQNPLNLALNRTYAASTTYSDQTADKACDGTVVTNWQAQLGSSYGNQWLQVNFGTSVSFDSVKISEYGDRTASYEIQYSTNGSIWTTAYMGTTIGTFKSISFAAVTGNYARIKFNSGTSTPIIYEFEIYKKPSAPAPNLALSRTYAASTTYSDQTAGKACDGTETTNWQAALGTAFSDQWLQVNFGSSVSFDSVRISEYGNRTAGFIVQYSTNGTTWSTAYTGTTIGSSKKAKFSVVSGAYARIKFTGGTDTPIIYEWEIYNSSSAGMATERVPQFLTVEAEEENIKTFKFYPNPATSQLHIEFDAQQTGAMGIYIYSSQGVLMKAIPSETSGSLTVNVAGLKHGTYVVKLVSVRQTIVRKLMIIP